MDDVAKMSGKLHHELKLVRRTGMAALDKLAGDGHSYALQVPELLTAARALVPGAGTMTRRRQIHILLSIVIDEMRSPSINAQKVGVWSYGMKLAAHVLFGLTEETQNLLPWELRKEALRVYNDDLGLRGGTAVSENKWARTDGGIESSLIGQLAAQMAHDVEALNREHPNEALSDLPLETSTSTAPQLTWDAFMRSFERTTGRAYEEHQVARFGLPWICTRYGGFSTVFDADNRSGISAVLKDIEVEPPPGDAEHFLRRQLRRGAFVIGGAVVRFGIYNPTDSNLSVTNITLGNLQRCRIPDGAFIQIGTQGAVRNTKVFFDLDSPNPVPLPSQDGPRPPAMTPFFDDMHIKVASGETEMITIDFQLLSTACKFFLEVEYLHRGTRYIRQLGSDGEDALYPFQISCYPYGRQVEDPAVTAKLRQIRYGYVRYRGWVPDGDYCWATISGEDFAPPNLDTSSHSGK